MKTNNAPNPPGNQPEEDEEEETPVPGGGFPGLSPERGQAVTSLIGGMQAKAGPGQLPHHLHFHMADTHVHHVHGQTPGVRRLAAKRMQGAK